MGRLHLSFFGPFRATLDTRPLTQFESNKVRALLILVAAEPERLHPREILAELLWPDQPRGAARTNLRHALAELRRVLDDRESHPPLLLITTETVQLNPAAAAEIDLVRFLELTADTTGADAWRAAVTLAQNPLLEGFALDGSPGFEEWLTVLRERVGQRLMHVCSRLVGHSVAVGDLDQAVTWAQRRVALEPWNEEAHRQVMALLAVSGQRAAALRQLTACTQRLAEELGVEPDPETQALAERIRQGSADWSMLQGVIAGVQLAVPGGPAMSPVPAVQPAPFLGRQAELAQVAANLADPLCHLLTLLGPGGAGKSRLAQQVMAAQAQRFAAGACWVSLTYVESNLLVATLLHILHVPARGMLNPKEQLLAFLAQKELLLVLDNFEHLVTEAGLLGEIVAACPKVKLLVTSRARLALACEWLVSLDGLAIPPAPAVGAAPTSDGMGRREVGPRPESYSGVQLFVHTVRRTAPSFTLTPDTAAQVTRICRLLDGIPLALELAAGWARFLPLAEVRARLEQSLDLLETTLRDVAPRHRSMRAVFDHSWRLLAPREQSIMRGMAVFRGGCSAAAAAAVTGASLADLAGLVDKTWLRTAPTGRYDLHELVRQYADEHLRAAGEAAIDDVRRRHCTYYTQLLRANCNTINIQHAVLSEILSDYGNLLEAWSWAVEHGDLAAAQEMVFSLWFAGDMVGACHFTLQLFAQAVERLTPYARPDNPNVAEWETAGAVLGWLMKARVDFLDDLGLADQGLAEAERYGALAQALPAGNAQAEHLLMSSQARVLADVAIGDYRGARRRCRELLGRLRSQQVDYGLYGREVGAIFWQAQCEGLLARLSFYAGRYRVAALRLERTSTLRRRIGERRFGAYNLGLLADLHLAGGKCDEAGAAAEQMLQQSAEFGDEIGIAEAHVSLGRVAAATGHMSAALAHFRQAQAVGRQSGHHALLMASLVGLGRAELALGHLDEAQATFAAAVDEFAALGVRHSVSVVGAVLGLGWTALAQGDLAAAEQHFRHVPTLPGCIAWRAWDAVAGLAEVCARTARRDGAAAIFDRVLHGRGAASATLNRVRQTAAHLGLALPPQVGRRRVVSPAGLVQWMAALTPASPLPDS